jgi:hypothetical protein
MEAFANTDTSTTNPFREIVDKLSLHAWQDVTIEYLEWVAQLLKQHGVKPETYGDVFKVLEFLHENAAVELKDDEDREKTLIRKGQNFGKNNI